MKLKNFLFFFAVLVVITLLAYFSKKYYEKGFFFFGATSYIKIPKEKIKKYVLKNGLTVLCFQNKALPKVRVQIAYDIGSSVEEYGERGLAHLLEHMIFKGTQKLSEGDIAAISRKYGATFNAFTANDITSYFFEVDSKNWKHFVPILADCMQNCRFESDHLASEVKTVIQELRRKQDNYMSLMGEKMLETLFPSNHPYHFPIIGFREDLASITAQQVKDFYKKYYHPKNATLFVVGDIDFDSTLNLAKENFEQIPDGTRSVPKFPLIVDEPSSQVTKIYREVTLPQIAFYWRIPGSKSKVKTMFEASSLILGWGENSRLYKRLVDDEKVATAVSVGSDFLFDAGIFYVVVHPKEGKIAACRAIIEDEVDKFLLSGGLKIELEKIAKVKKRNFFEAIEDVGEFTDRWVWSYLSTKNEFDIFNNVNAFYDIESQKLSEEVTQFLDTFLMQEIDLLPIPSNKRDVLTRAREKEDILDKKILSKHKRTSRVEKPAQLLSMPQAQKPEFIFPRPDKVVTLKNGLQVILKRQSAWPFIGVKLLLKDAPYLRPSRDGIALDLMMSMLIEGSKDYSKKQNVEFFENEGVAYSFDMSGVSLSMLNDRYKTILSHTVAVLSKPKFNKDALEKLKAIAIDNFERLRNEPSSVAGRVLKNLLYVGHPYAWSFEDAIDILKSITVSDLEKLHQKYVVPDGFILSVVGDFELDEMQNNIEAIFAMLPSGKHEKLSVHKAPLVPMSRSVDIFMLRDQAVLMLGQPCDVDIYHKDFVPLNLLNSICWRSLGSRLYELREETGLFYTAAGAWAKDASKVAGYNFLFLLVNPENLDGAELKIKNIVNQIGISGVTAQELEMARQIYANEVLNKAENSLSLAATFATLMALELGFDYYDNILKKVYAMPVEELNAIAKKYFNIENMSRVRVGRTEVIKKRRG